MADNKMTGERPAGQEAAKMPRRYVDMMSDAGFKAVFGDHGNKEVLIDLLNVLLPPHRKVRDVTYSTTEIPGLTPTTRGVRFDLRCTGEDGTTFIVELQRGKTDYFFRRCVSYTSKVYDAATLPGKQKFGDGIMLQDYDIPPVYLIAILEEQMSHKDETQWADRFVSRYTFMETSTKEFADETIFITFVELGRFRKGLSDCQELLDQWCYAFKHIGIMESMPPELEPVTFGKLFESAEIAGFDHEKRLTYEKDMYTERDRLVREAYIKKDGIEEGLEKGLKKGREEGRAVEKVEIARGMKAKGLDLALISELTGLTEGDIEKL